MELLRLHNLSKFYTSTGSVAVGLQNINLTFDTGEFVAVTGESGSGKTTIARVISGMLPFEGGEMFIDGRPTSHYTAEEWETYRRNQISFISQNYGILPGNTVLENVEAALRYYGADKQEARSRALDILGQVELSGFESRKAEKLSSGQKQRLAIARALAKPSRILIADEPTGNLDRANSDKIISLLSLAAKDRLVILITHEFEEAEGCATRKIELTDGNVVSDLKLSAESASGSFAAEKHENPAEISARDQRRLSRYTAGLCIRSKPVFSLVLFLTLALTAIMTFVFLGSFIVALDDTPTRVYTAEAFQNGDRNRLVVMKAGSENFTEAEVEKLSRFTHVDSIETRGYICDINYYYREGTDYRLQQVIVNGPDWHPVDNPTDVLVKYNVTFLNSSPNYMRTVPVTAEGIKLTAGKLPEGYYEVLSADSAYKTGDTVTVFVRDNRHWSVSSYLKLDFLVTGEAAYGSGLYFSDAFGKVLDNATMSELGAAVDDTNRRLAAHFVYTPYEPGRFGDLESPEQDYIYIPRDYVTSYRNVGDGVFIATAGTARMYVASGLFDGAYAHHVVVSQADYAKLSDFGLLNQISVYLTDYAYADRVIDALKAEGYIVFSPFRLGALSQDKKLATERLVTLGVCLAALIVTAVLQLLLLKNMFSSQYFKQFMLLKDIGLTKSVGRGAVIRMFMLFALCGELLAAAVVLLLNGLGVTRITDIFKYLELPGVLTLFAVHFIAACLTLWAIISALGKNVFASRGSADDLGIRGSEVTGE